MKKTYFAVMIESWDTFLHDVYETYEEAEKAAEEIRLAPDEWYRIKEIEMTEEEYIKDWK